MKKIFVLTLVVLSSLLLIPLTATTENIETTTPLPTVSPQQSQPAPQKIKVLISKTGKPQEMTAEDYLFGVLAGEMPALYETEALKAQAVASYTFLNWRKRENADKNYDITDDFTTDQCYITETEAREKWGSKYQEYESKIKTAIKSVENQILTYNGEIILSVYHSISSGKTESAKNVWGKDYPYLQTVDSSADRQSEHCISSKNLTAEQLKTALSLQTLPQNTAQLFTNITHTESGAVKTLKIGEKEYKGSQIRSLLDLKSSNFTVNCTDNTFTFTVYGYGHGVGMSQNGANEMAKEGKTYTEILKHYYKGCKITQNS